MSDKQIITPSWLGSEPVILIQGFFQAVVIAVGAFGFHLSGEQVGAASILTAAVLSLVTRQLVVPLPTAQAAAQANPTAVVVAAPAPAPDPAPAAPAASEAPSPEPAAAVTVSGGRGGIDV